MVRVIALLESGNSSDIHHLSAETLEMQLLTKEIVLSDYDCHDTINCNGKKRCVRVECPIKPKHINKHEQYKQHFVINEP